MQNMYKSTQWFGTALSTNVRNMFTHFLLHVYLTTIYI